VAEQIEVRAAGADVGRATGQGLVEYGLLLALIAVVAMVGLTFFGAQVSGLLSTIANTI
jgi:Flp pilus assembly pilin Flp